MKVYVAGPMRGYPEYNSPAFDAAAAALRAAGHEVFSPAEHDRSQYGDLTPENAAEKGFDLRKALAADLTWITLEADGVAVLDGWESSLGARAEVATALALGLLVQPVGVFGDPYGWRVTALPPVAPATDPNKPKIYPPCPEFEGGTKRGREKARKAIQEKWERQQAARFSEDAQRHWDEYVERYLNPSRQVVYPLSSPDGEVRSVSSTGGAKGEKAARYDLIPTYPLRLLAEHYQKGLAKYQTDGGLDNWRRGYEWRKSYAALQRHANLFWSGEDVDAETGSPHLVAVAWHAFALVEWSRHASLVERFDDRQDNREVAA